MIDNPVRLQAATVATINQWREQSAAGMFALVEFILLRRSLG